MSPTGRRVVHALLLALAACGQPASSATGAAGPVGVLAPSVEVVDLQGLHKVIAAHEGHALLVNFWALWCAPCVAELPDLVAIAPDFRAQGGQILGVSFDLMAAGTTLEGIQEKMTPFLAKRGIDFPILIYGDGDPAPVIERYDLPGPIPVTLAIDASGTVVAMHEGQAEREDFAHLAARALGKQ